MRIHTALVGNCYIRQDISIIFYFSLLEKEKIFVLRANFPEHDSSPFGVPPHGLGVVACQDNPLLCRELYEGSVSAMDVSVKKFSSSKKTKI